MWSMIGSVDGNLQMMDLSQQLAVLEHPFLDGRRACDRDGIGGHDRGAEATRWRNFL